MTTENTAGLETHLLTGWLDTAGILEAIRTQGLKRGHPTATVSLKWVGSCRDHISGLCWEHSLCANAHN